MLFFKFYEKCLLMIESYFCQIYNTSIYGLRIQIGKNYWDLETCTGKVRKFYFYRERQLPWGLWRTFGVSWKIQWTLVSSWNSQLWNSNMWHRWTRSLYTKVEAYLSWIERKIKTWKYKRVRQIEQPILHLKPNYYKEQHSSSSFFFT